MKIKTYQSGGIVYLPTVNRNEGVGFPSTTSSSSSSGDSTKVPGFAKEMIAMIKENGLNSDVSVFLNQLDRMLVKANDPTGENLSMRDILKAAQMANRVNQNYKSYATAEKSLEDQDAWAEPATSARGYLYIINKETQKLENVSPSEYDPEKHGLPLTNQDLMNLRREYPEMAFNSDVLDNLAQSVGMKTITDHVAGVIKDFGKTNITGYSEKQANSIQAGMNKIVDGTYGDIRRLLIAGPDGIYKINQESTIVDQDLNAALKYIKSVLPNSYLNTLNAKAAAERYSPDAMLITMLYANTDRKIGADYDNTATEDVGIGGGKGSKSGGSESLTEDNLAIRFAKGDLTETTAYISPKAARVSDQAGMALKAWNGGRPQDSDDKDLMKNNMADLLPQIFQFKGCDMSSISFANQTIDNVDLQGLVWDGDSLATRVALPYKIVNGKTVPDFSLLENLNKLNKLISEKPGLPQIEIQRELEAMESDGIVYDKQQNKFIIDPSRITFFGTIGAYGSSDLLDLNKGSIPYIEKLSRQKGREIKDEFNNLVQYGKPTHTKRERPKNGLEASEKGDFFWGNIYIPITDPMQAVNTTKNQFYPKTTFMHVNETYQIGQQIAAGQQQSTWRKNFN